MTKKLFLILFLCFLASPVWADVTLDQSYTEGNYTNESWLRYNSSLLKRAQVITAGASGNLTPVKFYINKVGSPTGNIFVSVYATSSGAPTGSAIATSNNVDVSTLSTSMGLIQFNFSTAYSQVNGTQYAISLEGDWTIDATNYVRMAQDYPVTGGTGYGGGQPYLYNGTSWVLQENQDHIFYTYITSVSARRIIMVQ